jgi:glutamate-1-semialdehyde aminotransferase
MAIAVRIARAFSGKDKIAFCGYHGWSDWYLSTNIASSSNLDGLHLSGLEPAGVPKGLAGTALPFHYNKIEELEEIFKNNDIGVVVMETVRHHMPENDFLKKVQALAKAHGAVFVLDEVSSGFRLTLGGAYKLFGIEPDIAVYAKALGNGYPIAAIVGRKEVMEAAQKSFISSTYWTERIGPSAALAVIKKMRAKKVPQHLEKIGKMIGKGWESLAKKHGLEMSFDGPNCLITFTLNYPNAQELKTLFIQEMLERGYLTTTTVYVSYAHKEADVKKYLKAVDEVFAILKDGLTTNTVSQKLKFPVAHTGFSRLT